MNITVIQSNHTDIALVQSDALLITDVQSALDLIATVNYETGCNRMALHKAAVIEDFFKLNTCLAGEILQKFVNYHVKIAFIGDFSCYLSKSLKDFMFESNHGSAVFFVSSEEDAIARLAAAH